MNSEITTLLEGTVRTATPLALAALGETVVERSGVINISLEGSIIAGALGSVIASGVFGVTGGIVGSIIAGIAVALIFAFFTQRIGADQLITGTALTMLALGATGTIYRIAFGSAGSGLTTPTLAPTRIPILSDIPLLGTALFTQPPITYLLYLLVPATWWWLNKTHAGLSLRAIGENPDAAVAAGIDVKRFRSTAILFGGALGGIAGGTLVLAQAGTFAEGMSAGRGFIAIAIVVLGRWSAVGAAVAALLFGATSALQYYFQSTEVQLPYQLFLALPYILTLLALVGVAGKVRAPAALSKSEDL